MLLCFLLLLSPHDASLLSTSTNDEDSRAYTAHRRAYVTPSFSLALSLVRMEEGEEAAEGATPLRTTQRTRNLPLKDGPTYLRLRLCVRCARACRR